MILATHPAGFLTLFPGFDRVPILVEGFTQGRHDTRVTHELAEVSGHIQAETLIDVPAFPPGWRCVSPCWTPTQHRFVTTLRLGVPGLQELKKENPADPFDLTGQTASHPSNHLGAAAANGTLKRIAETYKAAARKNLSINDMSLPTGGMFDLCNTYNPQNTCAAAPKGGHGEHRTGTDADIDQLGVPCDKDKHFKEAVTKAGAKFKCESGGRKHVDLD